MDGSSRSPRQPRSLTDIGEHRDNQGLGGISEVTDPTNSWYGSLRSKGQLRSWRDLQDHKQPKLRTDLLDHPDKQDL